MFTLIENNLPIILSELELINVLRHIISNQLKSRFELSLIFG